MVLFAILMVDVHHAICQPITLYVSKQKGQFSSYNGNFNKKTDRYEQGTVNLSTTGPVTYQINPGTLSIGINDEKTWNGTISANPNMTVPGTETPAALIADYDIKFSRPYGTGTVGTVESTYYCSDNGSAAGTGGCAFHGGNPGAHEMVRNTGQYTLNFNVVSVKVDLPDTICLGKTGQKDVTAISFPANAGNFVWTSSHPKVQITNGNQATANITLLDTTVKNATVKVTYSIENVSYEATGVLSTCECSCKPINGGLNVGPLHINLNVNPQQLSPDGNGNCLYQTDNASVNLTIDGVIKRTANLQNNVKVGFGKNCQSGDLSKVTVDWKGSIDIPAIEIQGVKTFDMKVKEVHLAVAPSGNLSGSVTVNVSNPVDRDLSLGKKFVMLRKGTNSDITFSYNNANGWAGKFDFSGIQNINIDLVKTSDGNDVTIANFKGNMDKDGTLTGDFKVVAQATYKTNLFKVTMKELTLGCELKIPDASFRLTNGSGKVQLSEMKAVTGTIDLGLNFPKAGGCVATVAAANITAFSMTLDQFNLQADFNKDFDLTKVEGDLKAKHNSFDVKIAVDKFKISNGSLEKFSCSGQVKYSSFSFNLQKADYVPVKLQIDAKVELSATGAAAMLEVKGFTIAEDGTITVGSIKGSLNKPPASISFSATFGNNRFTGSFKGDFADIGMDGDVDVGAKENPDYNFAYLSITAKVNVPLGNSGLKLTQLGGKVGYNYSLKGPDGPGDPQKGAYLAGLKLGVADVGNMCEVTGETIIQFGNGNVDITLKGTVAVLKNNKFFEGKADVTYKIPAQTLSGSVGAAINIPGNGWVFKSKNLTISFFFGGNKFNANGANMGGDMFGNKIQLTNGSFKLNGDLTDVTSLTGNLAGKASCSFSYSLNQSLFGTTFSGKINLDMNSNIDMGFDQNGIKGSFDVTVNGDGTLSIENALIEQSVSASASCNGSVSYSGGTLTLTGDMKVTLPISIPVWYDGDWTPTLTNQISTGTVSISF